MKYDNSDQLCEQISSEYDGTCLLHYSCGKDSIASWLQLRRYFKKIVPIYYHATPGLSFVEDYLKYSEDFFKTKIIRLPNPSFLKQLGTGVFQTPESWKIIKQSKLFYYTHENYKDFVKEDYKINDNVLCAVGVRSADSLVRGFVIKKYGAVNLKKKNFYPIFDWNIEKLIKELKESKIKLPDDYKMFGRSLDGIDYRFVKTIKEQKPEDFEKIKTFFPLIELELKRYEL
jgi:hypothetical protein